MTTWLNKHLRNWSRANFQGLKKNCLQVWPWFCHEQVQLLHRLVRKGWIKHRKNKTGYILILLLFANVCEKDRLCASYILQCKIYMHLNARVDQSLVFMDLKFGQAGIQPPGSPFAELVRHLQQHLQEWNPILKEKTHWSCCVNLNRKSNLKVFSQHVSSVLLEVEGEGAASKFIVETKRGVLISIGQIKWNFVLIFSD